MEKALRQTLFMVRGDVLAVLGRPLTLALLLAGTLAVAAPPLARLLRRQRPVVAPAARS
jgi:TctA family transporter